VLINLVEVKKENWSFGNGKPSTPELLDHLRWPGTAAGQEPRIS
jgi:hypothetical protein